ncbi:MAG: ECF-type sigma factor [Parvularcula sp.]
MSKLTKDEVAHLLDASRGGDEAAQTRLYALVHSEMSAIAAYLLRREYRPVTLATGDLVNEAVIRLMQSPSLSANDRAHFLAISSRVMRQVLIDAGRKRHAEKRQRFDVTLTENNAGAGDPGYTFQSLETALVRLQAIDADRADIVQMRYYGGMTLDEIAAAKGTSVSTIKRQWRSTRAWLKEAIEHDQHE